MSPGSLALSFGVQQDGGDVGVDLVEESCIVSSASVGALAAVGKDGDTCQDVFRVEAVLDTLDVFGSGLYISRP
jgi:hypothetical protein